MVLTDRNGKFEIIATETMYDADGNGLSLGSKDTRVTVTSDLDGDETIGDSGDISIASYNSAVKTINDFCDEIVTAEDNDGARSIGLSTDKWGIYSSEKFNSWYKGDGTINPPVEDDGKKLFIAHFLGLEDSNVYEKSYWYPATYVEEIIIYFELMTSNGRPIIFDITRTGEVSSREQNYGVLPIVINPVNITYIEE